MGLRAAVCSRCAGSFAVTRIIRAGLTRYRNLATKPFPNQATRAAARWVVMDTQRLILFFVFSFSAFLLWQRWDAEHRPPAPITTAARPSVPGAPSA